MSDLNKTAGFLGLGFRLLGVLFRGGNFEREVLRFYVKVLGFGLEF